MASQSEASITSASGETSFVTTNVGRMFIGVTGTISAGAILVVVKPYNSSTEFVADTIDQTAIQVNSNEAGTGYSFFEEIAVPRYCGVALKANATFSGSLTAIVIAPEAD